MRRSSPRWLPSTFPNRCLALRPMLLRVWDRCFWLCANSASPFFCASPTDLQSTRPFPRAVPPNAYSRMYDPLEHALPDRFPLTQGLSLEGELPPIQFQIVRRPAARWLQRIPIHLATMPPPSYTSSPLGKPFQVISSCMQSNRSLNNYMHVYR
jgi:hypothetical protein